MKANSKLLLIILVSLLFGCQKKDRDYYLKNPKQAEEKLQKCEKDKLNRGDYSLVYKDEECRIVQSIVLEIMLRKRAEKIRAQEEANIKYREERRRQQQEEHRRLKVQAEDKLSAEYGQLTWQQLIAAYDNSKCIQNDYVVDDSVYCQIFGAKAKDAFKQGIAEMNKTPLLDLIKQKNKYCKLKTSRFSDCGVWRTAVKIQTDEYFSDKSFEETLNLENNFCEGVNDNEDICNHWMSIIRQKTEIFAKTKNLLFLNNVLSEDKYCKINTKRKYSVCHVLSQEYNKQLNNYRVNLKNDYKLFTEEYNKCRAFFKTVQGFDTDNMKKLKINARFPCAYVSEAAYSRKLGDEYINFTSDL